MYAVLPYCPQHYFMAWYGADNPFNGLIDGIFKDVINATVNKTCNDSDNGAIMN
jgi:hypothetical protein